MHLYMRASTYVSSKFSTALTDNTLKKPLHLLGYPVFCHLLVGRNIC